MATFKDPTGRTERHPAHSAATADSSDGVRAQTRMLRRWLFEHALPLWWEIGADRALGGFHERLDQEGRPVLLPRRARVAARQVFCYCEGGRLGWAGPWRQAARHALDFLCDRFLTRDGSVVAVVGPEGAVSDATFDLYNQAFALLAFGCAYRSLGDGPLWKSRARALHDLLRRKFEHPDGGFREDPEGRLRLRSNPHMHLLEAALAWIAVDDDPIWRAAADEIADLCIRRFIDPATGALREFYAGDWSPVPGDDGHIVEPGHQYEWAFLLDRWATLSGRKQPPAVARLIAFADAHGVDRARGVAVNAVRLDGTVCDAVARLWPQTERLRAYLIGPGARDEARLDAAIATLRRYLDTPMRGLWFENCGAGGRFIHEAAPATSLYHIVGAIAELGDRLGVADGDVA
jgi:mannose-6-phosphate isomerase